MKPTRQVVLVGLAAADWQLFQPLLDKGSMPNLAALLARGVRGRLRTLQPQFNPLLWTSIATGKRAEAHRVLHWESADGDKVHPLSSSALGCQNLWDIVGTAGGSSLVVNWPVSYPAPALSGVCVSDQFFHFTGTEAALDAPASGGVYPAGMEAAIAELRLPPSELALE